MSDGGELLSSHAHEEMDRNSLKLTWKFIPTLVCGLNHK